jgi:putative ABC transport system substrate-binding protein
MKRRDFIAGLATAATLPILADAQTVKIPRVGFLGNSTAALEANLVEPFRQTLRSLGYVEGRDIVIDYRWAEGNYDRFPSLVAELIGAGVDVIVTAGTPAAFAVKRATTTIPCVMVAVGDPVGTGLVASLARPGGNLTGLTSIAPDLEGKRLALLREVIPSLAEVAVLWNPANPFHAISEKEVLRAGKALGMEVQSVAVRTSEELEGAFAAILERRPGALVVLADRVFLHGRDRIMKFAGQQRLPGVYAYRELVDAGGLMSYGPNYAEMHRQAATYVDRILKGTKPSDLPIQQPTKFEFVINLKTAKALGLVVPPTLLVAADEVIE